MTQTASSPFPSLPATVRRDRSADRRSLSLALAVLALGGWFLLSVADRPSHADPAPRGGPTTLAARR